MCPTCEREIGKVVSTATVCYHNCAFTISHTVLTINTRYILFIIYCLWSMPIFVCICISYLPWCSVIFDIFILVHWSGIIWSKLAVYFCIVLYRSLFLFYYCSLAYKLIDMVKYFFLYVTFVTHVKIQTWRICHTWNIQLILRSQLRKTTSEIFCA